MAVETAKEDKDMERQWLMEEMTSLCVELAHDEVAAHLPPDDRRAIRARIVEIIAQVARLARCCVCRADLPSDEEAPQQSLTGDGACCADCYQAQLEAVEEHVSDVFRTAFDAHPDREEDPGEALLAAREEAARQVPGDLNGFFDDEELTFRLEGR